MFFKRLRDKFSGRKRIDTQAQKIEDEFNKGNIVLPTGLINYENYNEFKEKTTHIKKIQNNLIVIVKNGK